MIKKLKVKIFSSFMLLVIMLLIAGLMSIRELRKMNNSFNDAIDNNYQSIEHALKVSYALEREDSGILLLYLGDIEEGKNVIEEANAVVSKSMIGIQKNATEPGEEALINSIDKEYDKYYSLLDSVVSNKTTTDKLDYKVIHNQFVKARKAVNALLELNQSSMYLKSSEMHNKFYQTMMPSIVSIILAIVFALLLNFFISHYFVNPLHKIIKATQEYRPPATNIEVSIKSEDELKTLQVEINNLIRRILLFYKSK